jgi:hypothetical protein
MDIATPIRLVASGDRGCVFPEISLVHGIRVSARAAPEARIGIPEHKSKDHTAGIEALFRIGPAYGIAVIVGECRRGRRMWALIPRGGVHTTYRT